ncbi:ATP-binding cassette domain-containing protein [Hymenobacter sp. B81]|uniref:ATP-binding cassette domain-containing protein n=1 Tax=Hymenobacter sp. B81 TaxID=3344878 RepID=UPI0037DD547C
MTATLLSPPAPDYLELHGVRTNNLQNVSLRIPKRQITVFTGVSGSGKSSLVFGTIAAEAQRQRHETFSLFVRNRLPPLDAPDADLLDRLSTAIVVDQKRFGGGARSTLGTITDTYALLRLLFARLGQPYVGGSAAFSFNDPAGMCLACGGLGEQVRVNAEALFDRSKSLNEGAILFPPFAVGTWYWNTFAQSGLFELDKPLAAYTAAEWQQLLHGKNKRVTYLTIGGPVTGDYEGVVDKFTRLFVQKDLDGAAEAKRAQVLRFVHAAPCPSCQGSRLNEAARSCRLHGLTIAECAALEVGALRRFLAGIADPVAAPVVAGLDLRLGHLERMGLDYLRLDRPTATLSGGEGQRVKMTRHLSSNLVDLLYIFDEPSAGLHPRDVLRLNELLRRLRDRGNTVLGVEHDRDVILQADHVVDVGPRAGRGGGHIVYEGPVAGLLRADTLTGHHLRRLPRLNTAPRQPTGQWPIRGAALHNLRQVSVDVPAGVLVVVTGVAGSGKSSLINGVFRAQQPGAVVIDRRPVGASSRSNPATYTGALDDIRRLFARAHQVSAALFSFNSRGACPFCQGAGFQYTGLAFLEPVRTTCSGCQGRRFTADVLRYTWQGKNISEVLALTVREVLEFFPQPALQARLRPLAEVGLDYLSLGQPLSTLSGGECQRLKIARELPRQGNLYLLDEPTTGLHLAYVGLLLALLNRLVDQGNSVVVIEHNPDVIAAADHIIDLGPEGGTRGGQVVFTGPPAQLLEAPHSLTGAYLRQALRKAAAPPVPASAKTPLLD